MMIRPRSSLSFRLTLWYVLFLTVRVATAGLLRVRDTGIGIPSSSLPRIFERFNVGDPSRSRDTGGMGLGLSIVKSIADVHAATVHVRSAPAQGSLFEGRFPIRGDQVPPSE